MSITVHEIFGRFGGAAKVGKIIGKPTEHASAMRRRGSIPVAYWAALIAAADADPTVNVTERDLIEAHTTQQVEAEPA